MSKSSIKDFIGNYNLSSMKSSFRDSISLLKLLLPYVYRSMWVLIFALANPILSSIFSPTTKAAQFTVLYPMMAIAFLFTPLLVSSFRSTSITKRIGVSRISKTNFYLSVFFVCVTISMLLTFLMIGLFTWFVSINVFNYPKIFLYDINTLQWGALLSQLFFVASSLIALGIAIGILIKKPTLVIGFGLFFLLIADKGFPTSPANEIFADWYMTFATYVTPWNMEITWLGKTITGEVNSLQNLLSIIIGINSTIIVMYLIITYSNFNKRR